MRSRVTSLVTINYIYRISKPFSCCVRHKFSLCDILKPFRVEISFLFQFFTIMCLLHAEPSVHFLQTKKNSPVKKCYTRELLVNYQ